MLKKWRPYLRAGLASFALATFTTVPVLAAQGFYVLDKNAHPGMLVSLTSNTGVVEPATDKSAELLVGVIGDSSIATNLQKGQTNVQTDGTTDTLVSTVNGDIRVGDRITTSTLVGVGSKLNGSGWSVGIAQASLDSSTKGAVTSTVTDSAGASHTVYVASVPMLVKVTYYQASSHDSESGVVSARLQNAVDSIAGKRASQTAIILGFLILVFGLALAGIIVSTAVKNGIQSSARQPLARQSIVRRMLQSFAMAIAILAAAVVAALGLIHLL